jgi:uncharacterized protein involved in exopolysaccharide biosynthesis
MFQEAPQITAVTGTPEALRAAGLGRSAQIDFGWMLSVVRRQKRLIVGATAASMLGALLLVLAVTHYYTAVTQLLIDPSDLRAVDNGLTTTTQMADANVLQVESQVRVITSDNVLRRVIAKEALDKDPEFGNSQKSIPRLVVAFLLSSLGLENQALAVDPTLAALNELHRRIRVKRAERTYVVDVAVTTWEREKSVRIANAIAQAYLAEQTAARAEAARRVSDSLSARLNQLKDRVRDAEERVEEYKSKNNIVGASGQLVNEQQLSEINNQLVLARARAAEAKSRFEQVQILQRSGAEVGGITEAVQSQTIMALRSQYAEIARRETEATMRLGARHPSVVEIQAQVRGLRRLIGEEVARIADAARNEFERARAAEESLSRSLDALKRNAMNTNEALVPLRELDREVHASRAVYESFLVRSRETGEQERLDTRNVRVISEADLPLRRSWPPGNLILAAASLIFGVSIGTGLAFLREANAPRKPPAVSGPAPNARRAPAGGARPAGVIPQAVSAPRSRMTKPEERLSSVETS